MSDEKIMDQARELANTQATFVETTKVLIEGVNVLADQVGNWTSYMRVVNETMREYSGLAKDLLDTHRAMLKAVGEMQVAINENTARLDAVIVKFESYFGSGGGLEYEN
ncbi:MAG: hypothetical protein QOH71_2178 [Blastocatellia bacterium]|jgi:hypothetical protein|nr:hypothetical protein [Blastocatellia bacterium]